MSYSDILNVVNQYGSGMQNLYANKANNLNNVNFNAGPVNPNSSGAFTPKTARDIYSSSTNVNNPMASFSDYKPYSGENLMMQGMKGMQYANIAGKISPYLASGASDLYGATIGKGTGLAGAQNFNLGPAAAVYGFTQNQNPYDYTQTEKLGTYASTAMAASQVAKLAGVGATTGIGGATVAPILGMNPFVLLGSLILGSIWSKKKKRKAKANIKRVKAEIKEQQDDIYSSREDQVKEMRQDMLSQQTTDLYNQRQGRYDNQYGGAYAEEGMKMDENIVAEFTGNELIVNDQDKVEKGLASGNYAMASAPIRKAMNNKQLTPGPETHQGNPMPVDIEGNIYVGGGKLPFKAKKGSGIYDHATDQFKSTMTDKEIAMVAQENINKWESNGMA